MNVHKPKEPKEAKPFLGTLRNSAYKMIKHLAKEPEIAKGGRVSGLRIFYSLDSKRAVFPGLKEVSVRREYFKWASMRLP